MKYIASLLMLIAFTVPVKAQSFQLSGGVLGYVSGNAQLPAADAVAIKTITPDIYGRTDNIIISAAAQNANLAVFDVAGPQYRLPLDSFLNKIKLDSKTYDVYSFAEIGTVTSSIGVSTAYSAGIGLERKISDSVKATLGEVRWLHGPVPTSNTPGGPQYTNDAIGVMMAITWGN